MTDRAPGRSYYGRKEDFTMEEVGEGRFVR
jgi:hypothetical protein